MVHSWDTVAVVVKVVDNDINEDYFVDPAAFTFNGRWNKHADMCLQYAHCLKENVKKDMEGKIFIRNSETCRFYMLGF